MVKKISALATGLTFVALATVVPAWAQSDSATTNVQVDSFLEFAIANDSGDACVTPGGDCPFGAVAGTVLDNSAGYDFAYSTANTTLRLRTNNTGGASVTAYATNGAGSADHCLVAGTDVITDTITDLPTLQAANDSANPDFDEDTGLAFRLIDTGTSAALRGADEDTQWGAGDVNGTSALWAAFPVLVGNAQIIFDTDAEQTVAVDGIIRYFAGVPSTQPAGDYACTANFTASLL